MNYPTLLTQAKQFRDAYSIPNSPNGNLTQKSLIDEEWSEFHEAFHLKDEHEQLKELCDLVYVCYQFAATYGIDLDKAMTLVFESNLSKLDEQGKPIYREDGKVLKGPNYVPPNLADCLPRPQLNYYDTNGK